MAQVTFGTFVPQGWKMELVASTTRRRSGPRRWRSPCSPRSSATTRSGCTTTSTTCRCRPTRRCSSAGRRWPRSASARRRIRLGQMVGCAPYRNPGLLAKITSNIDVISGGRLDWGIGAGWYEHEFNGLRLRVPGGQGPHRHAARDRRDREVDVDRARRHPTRAGTSNLQGAQCDPKPVQQPHPPIWIGGGGEQLTLRVVARHADRSNFGGKPHEFAHKCRGAEGALQGRRPRLRRDHQDLVAARCSSARPSRRSSTAAPKSFWGEPFESWREGNLVGTPEQVAEKIQTYVDLGCTGFVPWCSRLPRHRDAAPLRARRSCPNFR